MNVSFTKKVPCYEKFLLSSGIRCAAPRRPSFPPQSSLQRPNTPPSSPNSLVENRQAVCRATAADPLTAVLLHAHRNKWITAISAFARNLVMLLATWSVNYCYSDLFSARLPEHTFIHWHIFHRVRDGKALDASALQKLRVNPWYFQILHSFLDTAGEVHVGFVNAGSLNDCKSGHDLNHFHTGLPVTGKKDAVQTFSITRRQETLKTFFFLITWGERGLTRLDQLSRATLGLSPPEDLDTVSWHHPPTCFLSHRGLGPHNWLLWY